MARRGLPTCAIRPDDQEYGRCAGRNGGPDLHQVQVYRLGVAGRRSIRVIPSALILPTCNTEAINLHLVEIAATVAPGAHSVLLVDQAGWHLSTGLVVPPNITIMALPPKCPELNPVENVWPFLRDNWLSNRVFKILR